MSYCYRVSRARVQCPLVHRQQCLCLLVPHRVQVLQCPTVPESWHSPLPASQCFRAGLMPCLFSPRKEKKVDNMKPKHPDEQEIPFRLRELMRSREAMKRPGPGKQQAAGGKQSWPKLGCPGPG